MAKNYNVEAYNPDGTSVEGAYIEDGRTYDSSGKQLSAGAVVKAANGKYYQKGVGEISQNQFIDFALGNTVQPNKRVETQGSPGYSAPAVNITSPSVATGNQLTNTYGITQDRQEIANLLTEAINTQYDNLGIEQARNEDRFYDQLGAVQQTVLDTLGANNINAIQTGAARGVQAANELSAVLGLSQQGVAGATGLADARAQLATGREQALAQAQVDALTQSNNLGLSLGEIAANLYNADTVRYGSELNYNAALDAALAGLGAQQIAANAQVAASANQQDPLAAVFARLTPEQQEAYLLARAGLGGNNPNGLYGNFNTGYSDSFWEFLKSAVDSVQGGGTTDNGGIPGRTNNVTPSTGFDLLNDLYGINP